MNSKKSLIDSTASIHPTAIVEEGARVGPQTYIGPYCCIGKDVTLGANVRLNSHVVIEGTTLIDDEVTVFPFASLGQKPQDLKYKGEKSRLEIGKRSVIRECVTASIGTEGGGMVTRIGENCLIMAYCHIAHDCLIGNNVILVNCVNLAGHVVVGDNVTIGGMSAVKQFVHIGKLAFIGGCSGVDRDVLPYSVARCDRSFAMRGVNVIGLKRAGASRDEIASVGYRLRESQLTTIHPVT
ncbi:MAG: acyl-ACP--UDP-N-acetylglucosamine O-acyltransferase [Holosporales bacterium]|jgi:UDP-N-acetylglucosamine acyltransferase|nr:acyl-ACP--UDP-N-acetylglucosamine O-acyltransferase [Holosporales bacterium]